MIEQPVHVRDISEVVMTRMDPAYVRRVYWYLGHILGCKVTFLGELEGHRVEFPTGTREETYMGQSTQFTHRTTIRFPSGHTLTKYVTAMLPDTTRSVTLLAFPNTVLDGPEHTP